ncbi:uncharacterized protein LOC144135554 [Amblyomma americanum]
MMASSPRDQPRPLPHGMRRKWMIGLVGVALVLAASIVWAQSYQNLQTAGSRCKVPALRACLPTSVAAGHNASADSSARLAAAPWFYVRSRRKGHCLQWNADLVCLGRSLLHFRTEAFCHSYCERGVPRPRCTKPIDSGMLHCSSEEYHEGRRTAWWYYDSHQRACVKWGNVCLENTYASLRACAAECLS